MNARWPRDSSPPRAGVIGLGKNLRGRTETRDLGVIHTTEMRTQGGVRNFPSRKC
jgi:hypothetical protein